MAEKLIFRFMGELIKNLTTKLRLLRTEKEYTQENMAELLEMSVSSYARIERGEKVDVGIMKIEQIAKIFNVAPTELIKSVEGFSNIQNGNCSAMGTNNHIQVNSGEEDMKFIKSFILNLSERLEKLEQKI